MIRHLESWLSHWKVHSRRKPLILRGARQVGKTYTVLSFGRKEFAEVIVCDFERDPALRRAFEGSLDAPGLIRRLEVETGQRIHPGRTLLFLDEIQACERALVALRYLYEQVPELHVIAAGSLLELAVAPTSFPVGRVEFAWLYPMSFREFLGALGQDILVEHLPNREARQPLAASIHEKFLEKLREYFLVGGMPEAVAAYVESGSMVEAGRVHAALSQSYLDGLTKYGTRIERGVLEHIFESLPRQVGRQIKYTALYPEKRVETIKNALGMLFRSQVAHKVSASSAQGLPLMAGATEKTFKSIFLDIGMMQHLCGISAREVLGSTDLMKTFEGALAEQFVGQELLAQRGGSENGHLYYWARAQRNSSAEVDYVIAEADGPITPLEVKSGPAGKLRSLHQYLAEHADCKTGLVLSSANVADMPEQRIRFLPLYLQWNPPSAPTVHATSSDVES